MREDILETTTAVLGKYGALSRVRIARTETACMGLVGTGLERALAGLFPQWPTGAQALCAEGGRCIVRRDRTGERYEIWVPRSDADALWETLGSRLPCADSATWRLALVRAGEADVQRATSDLFLPQMLGYDASGAVSFRKGCYTGQEIIARTHYKGSVKRRLQRLGGAGGSVPAVGTELVRGDDGRNVGSVVESAPSGASRFELLAVLADEALDGETCWAQTADGTPLEVLPLPCAVP